eukprot:5738167-Prymnesium_polylepis.1
MVFKIPNAVIEGSIDSVCDMTEKFGFHMSMANINVPEEGTSPANCLPRKSLWNRMTCPLLSPKSPKMLPGETRAAGPSSTSTD